MSCSQEDWERNWKEAAQIMGRWNLGKETGDKAGKGAEEDCVVSWPSSAKPGLKERERRERSHAESLTGLWGSLWGKGGGTRKNGNKNTESVAVFVFSGWKRLNVSVFWSCWRVNPHMQLSCCGLSKKKRFPSERVRRVQTNTRLDDWQVLFCAEIPWDSSRVHVAQNMPYLSYCWRWKVGI